jgi:hypothetical protein
LYAAAENFLESLDLFLPFSMFLVDELGFNDVVFVDGGGDSLIVRSSDSPTGEDPFKGGDAEMLAAMRGRKGIIQAIISVGLDIKEDKFFETVELLKARGGYYGKVNLLTGEKSDFKLNHLFSFDGPHGIQSPWINKYFELCEKVLVLKEEDLQDEGKMMSHTGVVTYVLKLPNFVSILSYVKIHGIQVLGSQGSVRCQANLRSVGASAARWHKRRSRSSRALLDVFCGSIRA